MLIDQAEEEAEGGRRGKERIAGNACRNQAIASAAAYAGTYHDAGYGEVQIAMDNGALALAWSSFHAPLEHYHYDTFETKGGGQGGSQVLFRTAANGSVIGLNFMGVDFARR